MHDRVALVDKCGRCGALMRRASPAQHAVLQLTLEDFSRGCAWPRDSKRYHGPKTWWQLIVAAYDRHKHLEQWQLLPAIDGLGFDGNGMDFVRGERRRRGVNSIEISEIIEYARALAVEWQVPLSEPKKKKAA